MLRTAHTQSQAEVRVIESVQCPRPSREPATPPSQHGTSKTQVLSVATPEDSWAKRLPCPASAERLENREAIDSETLPMNRTGQPG